MTGDMERLDAMEKLLHRTRENHNTQGSRKIHEASELLIRPGWTKTPVVLMLRIGGHGAYDEKTFAGNSVREVLDKLLAYQGRR